MYMYQKVRARFSKRQNHCSSIKQKLKRSKTRRNFCRFRISKNNLPIIVNSITQRRFIVRVVSAPLQNIRFVCLLVATDQDFVLATCVVIIKLRMKQKHPVWKTRTTQFLSVFLDVQLNKGKIAICVNTSGGLFS